MARYKILGAVAAVILALWFLTRRAMAATASNSDTKPTGVTGNVEAGIPTVKGSGAEMFGGEDYGVAPEPRESETERLIRESNAAIDAYEVPENPWGIT